MRGFGDSDKPDGPFGSDQHAADMLALLDALGLRQVGVVGHDVGRALMQPLARTTPVRFFFNRMPKPDPAWDTDSRALLVTH